MQTTSPRGSLTPADLAGLQADELRRLIRAGFVLPIAGGAPDEDEDDKEKEGGEDRGSTVPLSEHRKERKRARTAEARIEELEAELTELRNRDLSDNERLKAENEALKAKVGELESSNARERRERLVTDAAREAGFHNPRAALGLLDRATLDSIEDEAAAISAIRDLARRDAWLVKDAGEGDKRSGVEKILADGKRVDSRDANGEKNLIPADELNGWTADQHAEAMDRDPERYQRSLEAAAKE